ncbi:hypothetical protein QBC34DRAFT_395742 [Podospora aff. communis PSN243]|uniref:Uncharacterized protein n=1 Tax=Podospora aff. communis PSN243 TaxID=3040156 RepID=A0AAV9H075_9PEZI|nr:hypothetical protein QBC34DRAFT_395742 [Podospora aff. communis PSN243]
MGFSSLQQDPQKLETNHSVEGVDRLRNCGRPKPWRKSQQSQTPRPLHLDAQQPSVLLVGAAHQLSQRQNGHGSRWSSMRVSRGGSLPLQPRHPERMLPLLPTHRPNPPVLLDPLAALPSKYFPPLKKKSQTQIPTPPKQHPTPPPCPNSPSQKPASHPSVKPPPPPHVAPLNPAQQATQLPCATPPSGPKTSTPKSRPSSLSPQLSKTPSNPPASSTSPPSPTTAAASSKSASPLSLSCANASKPYKPSAKKWNSSRYPAAAPTTRGFPRTTSVSSVWRTRS